MKISTKINTIFILTLIFSVAIANSNSLSSKLLKKAQTSDELPSDYVNIVGPQGLCISHAHDKDVNLQQSSCSSSDYHQWMFVKHNEGYVIRSKAGLVVDNAGWGKGEGNRIIGFNDNKTTNQIWVASTNANGSLSFRNPDSGKCIGIKSPAELSNEYGIFSCSSSDVNQQFKLTKPAASIEVSSDYVNIVGPEGTCMEAPGKSGSNLNQATCSSSNYMSWKLIPYREGYVIKSKADWVVDNAGWKTNDGNPIIGFNDNKTTNQVWVVERGLEGSFVLRNPNQKKCIDNRGSAGIGNNYGLISCRATDKNQQFRFLPVADKFKIPNGMGNIVGPGGLCVESSDNDGHDLLQRKCGDGDKLQWEFIPYSNGYVIKSRNGRVFDNKAWNSGNGNPIQGYRDNKTTNQIWVPELASNGVSILLRNPETNKCIDNKGSVSEGGSYGLNVCNSSDTNQHFKPVLMTLTNPPAPVVVPAPVPAPVLPAPAPVPVLPAPAPAVPATLVQLPTTGYYNLLGPNGLCAKGSAKADNLTHSNCDFSNGSLWTYIPFTGGYLISNLNGLVIDNSYSKTNDGNPIVVFTNKQATNQIWRAESAGNNSFILRNPASDKCIGLSGTNYVLTTCNLLDANQLFKLGLAAPVAVPTIPAVVPSTVPAPIPTNYVTYYINYYTLPAGVIDPSTLGPIQPFVPYAGVLDSTTLRN